MWVEGFRQAGTWTVVLGAVALSSAAWATLFWGSALGISAMIAVTSFAMVRWLQRVADEVDDLLVERQLTAAQLSTLAEEMELILDAAPDGIYGVNLQGQVLFANRRAAQLLGVEREELFAASIHDLLHSEGDASGCGLCQAAEQGEPYAGQQDQLRRGDGEAFDARCASTPMYKGDELIGAVVSFSDTTGQRQLEKQLRDAQKLTAMGQLAAGVAHEINTPTQYVKDNVDFLKDAFEDSVKLVDTLQALKTAVAENNVSDELWKELEVVERRCDFGYLRDEIPRAIDQSQEGLVRVASIVRAMKELSHPDDDEHVETDINGTVRSTVTVARNEWKYVADLDLELDEALPRVSCNPGEVSQTVLNLVVNAAHAIDELRKEGDPKGRIVVRTVQVDEHVEIRVTDTGPGVALEVRERIFEPFFTTKEIGKGTGQGLALAHEVVVKRHGGKLHFETRTDGDDRGTTFIVELPLAVADVA